jgi:hypothetical protein
MTIALTKELLLQEFVIENMSEKEQKASIWMLIGWKEDLN